VGTVAAVTGVANPVSLARRVMTDTPHTLLVADGAARFADSIWFPRVSNEDLMVATEPAEAHDTVGAVAMDDAGNLAAATSTGGTRGQMPGRVGDVPMPGCGGYADNGTGAVSATGDGEAIMKLTLSKQVCDFIGAGMEAQRAVERALALLEERLPGSSAGLIAVDRAGQIGITFNTRGMPWAIAGRNGARSGMAPAGR
jgi:beta-aspartyl-peptidase (threonine type)